MGAVIALIRGRVPANRGALCLRMFPIGDYGHSRARDVWVYALGFTDGRVKLGITQRPRERLRHYFNASPVAWVHLFGKAPGALKVGARHAIEIRALLLASKVGKRIGHTEYFTQLAKADAIGCVRSAFAELAEPAKV